MQKPPFWLKYLFCSLTVFQIVGLVAGIIAAYS
jgi:hypothetical protein